MAKRRNKASKAATAKAVSKPIAAPEVRVWQICKWKTMYAAPVERGTPAARYEAMYPMQYVRMWCGQATVEGNFCEIQFAAIRAAGGLELFGIAIQLLRMAASRDRFGGRLVDHLGHPASPREIAEAIGVKSLQRMHIALRTLSGPRIAFVEAVPLDSIGTPIAARTAARDAHANLHGDGRENASGSNAATAGDRESRQVGGLESRTGNMAAAAPRDGAPAGGLPDSCGPPGYADQGMPKEQEQEQEKDPDQAAGQESAAPTEEKKIGKGEMGSSQAQAQAQARGREAQAASQPNADVPTEPTGADPFGGRDGEADVECVDEVQPSGFTKRHADSLTLAVYAAIYPTAQFESCELLKGDNGRGLSQRRFKARELGAISSALDSAMGSMSHEQCSSLNAWCISAAEEVYRKAHRKVGRAKPLASVWIWRLNEHMKRRK